MKGIILAGGSATHLRPASKVVCKQLLPVYDKPMIYYPLSTLISAGISDILIITTQHDADQFIRLLGDGSDIGCKFTYKIQTEPRGLAEAFILGEDFIGKDRVCLILGDNIFYGGDMHKRLVRAGTQADGVVFAYKVHDPERYGVVAFDNNGVALSIEEKPTAPKSQYAVPGVYLYGPDVVEIAKNIQPSDRGELEITEVNNVYLAQGKLRVEMIDESTQWFDAGTFASLHEVSGSIKAIQERQGSLIGSIELEAHRAGFISAEKLHVIAQETVKSGYGKVLLEYLEALKKTI